jgi:hypothetical protein
VLLKADGPLTNVRFDPSRLFSFAVTLPLSLGAKMKDRSFYEEPERMLADLDHMSAYWGRQAASQRNGVRAQNFAKNVDQARALAARIRESMR